MATLGRVGAIAPLLKGEKRLAQAGAGRDNRQHAAGCRIAGAQSEEIVPLEKGTAFAMA